MSYVSLSYCSEKAEETTEDGQAELGDDDAEITEQDVDRKLETGEENTGDLNNGDDDGTDELTVESRNVRAAHRKYLIRTYPTWKSNEWIWAAAANGWASKRAATAPKAVKTS